jgi:hypothetical protein
MTEATIQGLNDDFRRVGPDFPNIHDARGE